MTADNASQLCPHGIIPGVCKRCWEEEIRRSSPGPRLGEGELPTIPRQGHGLYVPQVASQAAQDQLRKALTWACTVLLNGEIMAETPDGSPYLGTLQHWMELWEIEPWPL